MDVLKKVSLVRIEPSDYFCFQDRVRVTFDWSFYLLRKINTAQRGTQTHDPEIKSLKLYRLS